MKVEGDPGHRQGKGGLDADQFSPAGYAGTQAVEHGQPENQQQIDRNADRPGEMAVMGKDDVEPVEDDCVCGNAAGQADAEGRLRGELSSRAISRGIRAIQARKERPGFGKERAIRIPLAIASHPRRSNSCLSNEKEIGAFTHAPDLQQERCLYALIATFFTRRRSASRIFRDSPAPSMVSPIAGILPVR